MLAKITSRELGTSSSRSSPAEGGGGGGGAGAGAVAGAGAGAAVVVISVTETYDIPIPNEIWVKILSHLGQKDLVHSARGVCSTLRNIVDTHFLFNVVVHEDMMELKRLNSLRIRDCVVSKMTENVDILGYPEFVKKIRFWGTLQPQAMLTMLNKTMATLEHLSYTQYPLVKPDLFPPDLPPLTLTNLIKLEVLAYNCGSEGANVSQTVMRNLHQLFRMEMPSLRRFSFNLTCKRPHADELLVTLFTFLSKVSNNNKAHMEFLNTSLIPTANTDQNVPAPVPFIPPKVLVLVQQLQVEILRLGLTSYLPAFIPMILNQKNLVDLRLAWAPPSDVHNHPMLNTGIPVQIVYPPILNSIRTLTSVELRDLNLKYDEEDRRLLPFNFRVFLGADSLKRIAISRNKGDRHNTPSPPIYNLNLVLPSLEELQISRLKCVSEQLQNLIENSEALKKVTLFHVGSCAGQGVHGGILESLCGKEGIQLINISPLSYQEPHERAKVETLKLRFPGMFHTIDTCSFDFDRWRAGIPQAHTPRQPQDGLTQTILNVLTSAVSDVDFRRWVRSCGEGQCDNQQPRTSSGRPEGSGRRSGSGRSGRRRVRSRFCQTSGTQVRERSRSLDTEIDRREWLLSDQHQQVDNVNVHQAQATHATRTQATQTTDACRGRGGNGAGGRSAGVGGALGRSVSLHTFNFNH